MMRDLTEGNPQSLLWRFTIPMYFCPYIMLATFSDLILRVVPVSYTHLTLPTIA